MVRMLCLFVCCISTQLLAQTSLPRDASQIQFQGNKAYTTESIRDALQFSADFIAACEPVHTDQEFIRTLEQLLKAAYLRNGFLQCAIRAKVSDREGEGARYQVELDEGNQTLRDEMEVDAPASLQAFLKSSWNDYCQRLPKPVWVPGHPWNPEPDVKTGIQQHVDQWLRNIGYQPWTARATFPETAPHRVGLRLTFHAQAIKPKIVAIELARGDPVIKKHLAEFEIDKGMDFIAGMDRKLAEKIYLLGMFQQVRVDTDAGAGLGEVQLRVQTARLSGIDQEKLTWSRDLKRVWQAALATDCDHRPSHIRGMRPPFIVDAYFTEHDAVVEVTSNEQVISRLAHDADRSRVVLQMNEQEGAFTINRLLLQVSLDRDANNPNALRIDANFKFGDNHLERPESRFFITVDGWDVIFPLNQVKRTEEAERIVWESNLGRLITTPANEPIELTIRSQDREITCYWDQDIPDETLQFLTSNRAKDLLVQAALNRQRLFVSSPTVEKQWPYMLWMIARDLELYPEDSEATEFLKCYMLADHPDHAAAASRLGRFLEAKPRGILTTLFALAALQKCQSPELLKKHGTAFQQRMANEKGGSSQADWDMWFVAGSRPHAIAECFDPVAIQSLIAEQSEFMLASDPIQMAVKAL